MLDHQEMNDETEGGGDDWYVSLGETSTMLVKMKWMHCQPWQVSSQYHTITCRRFEEPTREGILRYTVDA